MSWNKRQRRAILCFQCKTVKKTKKITNQTQSTQKHRCELDTSTAVAIINTRKSSICAMTGKNMSIDLKKKCVTKILVCETMWIVSKPVLNLVEFSKFCSIPTLWFHETRHNCYCMWTFDRWMNGIKTKNKRQRLRENT